MKSARIRPMTSLTRAPLLTIRSSACRTSSKFGGSALSQRRVGFEDLLLSHSLLGDVPENRLQPDDFSFRVAQRCFDNVHVDLARAWRLVFLHRFVGFSHFEHASVIPLILFGEFLGEKVEIRLSNDFLQRPAQYAAKLLVGKGEAKLEVFAENVLRQSLDQRMIKRF